MKLYIYEHCPFSARVRYVAAFLNIAIDVITLDYDDAKTTTELIGRKQVPLLINGDGSAIAESLDIIQHLLDLADSVETNLPSQTVLEWQSDAFLPLQQIGYPRWSNMDLQEFATDSAKKAWRSKKETEALNFDALIANTAVIAEAVETYINKVHDILNLDSNKRIKLVDQAIIFSILRGFFSAADINWDISVKTWMESASRRTNIKLLKQGEFMSKLFEKTSLKNLALQNRIVMAPMTRARTSQPGNIPNEMMATYYKQRATAGLVISEATQISDDSQGYSFTPGVYTDAQVKGWQSVTKAAKNTGAAMFCQLWHVGRVSHPTFQKGELPIAPSALAPVETKVWISDDKGNGNMVDCIQPREMTQEDIDRVVNDFAYAAKRSLEAGFDGVELHGGNGYLIDQFLRTNSNKRTDNYGGSRENRIRFLIEVVDAVVAAVGADKVGVRLAPFITFKDMNCPDIVATILEVSKQLQARNVAYIHLSEADWDDAPVIPESFRIALREAFTNTIIVAGSYTKERADQVIDKGYADLVAFGRPFVSNPDLVLRLQNGSKLADLDNVTLFGGNEHGYIDYPRYNEI